MSLIIENENNEVDIFLQRKSKLNKLKSEGFNIYPSFYKMTHSISKIKNLFQNVLNDGERQNNEIISTAGRILLKRWSGKKLIFYTIEHKNETLQLMCDIRDYSCSNTEPTFKEINEIVHRGDIIGVTGYVGKSKRGELSLFPKSIKLLSPCLHQMPKEHYGITNIDTRISKRYLDLMINRDVRNNFITRSKIISFLRNYLNENDFIEVETSILDTKHGGATARPFITFHNELKQNMYLRIAPELRLKELIIGGLDRVYEIGKQFRNEGIDPTHNPEFTSIELYQAYSDYYQLQEMTEIILSKLVLHIFKSYEILFKNKEKINFSPPFKVIDMIPYLEEKTELNFPIDMDSNIFNEKLIIYFKENNLSLPNILTNSKLIDKLVEIYIEPECWNPTFIINHPVIMSPLAKTHRNDIRLTERFELFVAKMEICNAYTELNDPEIQLSRFIGQQKDKEAGDKEAHIVDKDFITALEYGLPPTAGWGMGIDRLCMLLTNNIESIKEVILFPARNI